MLETYHFTNEGVCSWYDFAREIMTLAELDCAVHPIPITAYPTPAKFPYYSLMDKSKITEGLGYNIPYWKNSLAEFINQIKAKVLA